MASDLYLLPGLLVYLGVAAAVLALRGVFREWLFAIWNVITVGALFYARVRPYTWVLGIYLLIVVAHWQLTRMLAKREGRWPWVAFAFPLVALFLIRFVPGLWNPIFEQAAVPRELRIPALYFVGISYMAFRLSWFVLEVRNGVVEPPSLAHFLGYAFFPPIMSVGPISRFSAYDTTIRAPSREVTPLGRSLFRIVVGIGKFEILANLINQVAYQGLVLDGRPHKAVDWLISSSAYYLYLYCNFSGFCDIAIGIAGVLGFKIDENFDNPFAARNVQVLWNRWHITLGAYMRDVLFTPLSKWLVAKLGPKRREHAVPIAIFTVFVLIGLWHGLTANFILFGIMNGTAVVATHYWGVTLKKRLGKERLRAYQQSKVIHALGVAGTFLYFTVALALFANTRSLARNLEFFFHR